MRGSSALDSTFASWEIRWTPAGAVKEMRGDWAVSMFGSSPRGLQTLILGSKVRALTEGRFNVSFDDIQSIAPAALRHRLILNFEAEAEGLTTDHVVAEILNHVPRDVVAESVA